jgi:hypothetical protein
MNTGERCRETKSCCADLERTDERRGESEGYEEKRDVQTGTAEATALRNNHTL